MAEETISADEQKDVDVQESEDQIDLNDGEDEVSVVKSAYEAELAKKQKEIERLAKFEARYKSQMKANSQKPSEKAEITDINSVVEQKIAEMSERNEFRNKHGEEIYQDVLKIREKHPTLTLEEAMNLSPVAKDPARTANPDTSSSPGRAAVKDSSSKTITYEAMSKLPQSEYNIMSDKVKS
jgi:hypothetical protein